MPIISLRCKNCGSMMSIDLDSKTVHCVRCSSTFLLGELLDKKDVEMIDKFKPTILAEKMEASEEIKQGETKIYAGDYSSAEKHFKRAIALDEDNFRAYLGVVKAKTKNFNIIPPEDDYAEYAKLATKHVDKENSAYLKNELLKIILLKKEKLKKEELAKKQQTETFLKLQKKKNIINICLCLILICVISAGAVLLPILLKKKNDPAPAPKQIILSSATEFASLNANPENLSAHIKLSADIDFENQLVSAIGTKNNPFCGTFDANGYTIKNLKIKDYNSSGENAIGLFGYANQATFKNIKLDNCYVSENRNNQILNHNIVGLVCAVAANSTFENIEVLNTCEVHLSFESHGTFSIGGICGQANGSSFTNCYSNAEILTNLSNISSSSSTPLSYFVGGLVGKANSLTSKHCYSTSLITIETTTTPSTYVEHFVSGLVGLAEDEHSKLSNSYFAGEINVSKTSQTINYFSILSNFKTIVNFENCFALFGSNIKQEDASIDSSALLDQLVTGLKLVADETNLLELVQSNFDSNIWNNETVQPSIK